MQRSLALTAAAASLLVGSAVAVQAAPPKAKVSPATARAIAAKKLHGKSIKTTYEFEDGRWQYAVIVMKGKQMYEVEVNATTGKVMDTEKTSAAEEAREAAADRAAASGKTPSHTNAEAGEASEKGEKAEVGASGK